MFVSVLTKETKYLIILGKRNCGLKATDGAFGFLIHIVLVSYIFIKRYNIHAFDASY